MEHETLLPARLFLLAYDPKKQRLTNTSFLGTLLRAGALTELVLAGHVADQDGRVVVVGNPVVADPLQSAVLAEIAASSRPRKWQHWIGRRGRAAVTLVREQLAAEHVIRAERQRVLGLFPIWNVSLRDTRTRSRLAESARRALRGGEPVDRLDLRDAAVVALAASGELKIVVSRADRRQFKRRLEALGERVGPVVKGLRKAVQAAQSAAAA
ncbi:GOLPH3/VPS74 family protein [Cryptosporangium minutisporangium]|uniref:GPP34 family phosphoprotein n=1 Tax=Cryptosporangium minutisporangium TaxID=113569 RepID=A0ABP6T6Z7_9ACTN